MTLVITNRQVLCRWCQAPAEHLRDDVQLCKHCAAVVDQLGEHTRLLKRNTLEGGT